MGSIAQSKRNTHGMKHAVSEEKNKILGALDDGQAWLKFNPKADAEKIKEKHKEIVGICVSWWHPVGDCPVLQVCFGHCSYCGLKRALRCDVT